MLSRSWAKNIEVDGWGGQIHSEADVYDSFSF